MYREGRMQMAGAGRWSRERANGGDANVSVAKRRIGLGGKKYGGEGGRR